MTTSPEIERKVRQLDNDVQSIYDLLTDLDVGVKKLQAAQLRQGSRLDQIEDRLTGVDDRLTGVDDKLDIVLDLLRRDRPADG
jgi:archaellum component FlaC